MSRPVALVTGAGGEMGHLLLPALAARGYDVVGLDLAPLDPDLARHCVDVVTASVLDHTALDAVFERRAPEIVFHLAAVLSTKAEADPDLAHEVNVDGTVGVFRRCRKLAERRGRVVRVMFPSSIAVYGLPDAAAKNAAGTIAEDDWNRPTAAYGCNKLYGELLGTYWTRRGARAGQPGVDFRAIRFPGLLSAETVPSGGTSDYGPEMLHAAAQDRAYSCFVRPDTRLPFMTMPDAVDAFLKLADAPAESLSARVYNVRAFSPSAEEFRRAVLDHFPRAQITFQPVAARQAIVDSWPADIDDSRARRDWGLAPRHEFAGAISEYLIPALRRRYAGVG